MDDNRGSLYLLTGLVIGLVIGLIYARVIFPAQFVDNSPAALAPKEKDQYRALIAAAYVADGNLPRAKVRLELLGDKDLYAALAEQAKRSLAEGSSPDEARALGLLVVDLGHAPGSGGVSTPEMQISTTSTAAPTRRPTASQTASPTATATITPVPDTATFTPGITPETSSTAEETITVTQSLTGGSSLFPAGTLSATPGGLFVLKSQEAVCDRNLTEPAVQVLAFNASGDQVPGVEAIITWEGGEQSFFTGLKPELGLGYADFTLEPGVVYSLRLAQGGQPVNNITAAHCEAAGETQFWKAVRLTFVQP